MTFFVKQVNASGQKPPEFLSVPPLYFCVSANFIVSSVYHVDKAERLRTFSMQKHT